MLNCMQLICYRLPLSRRRPLLHCYYCCPTMSGGRSFKYDFQCGYTQQAAKTTHSPSLSLSSFMQEIMWASPREPQENARSVLATVSISLYRWRGASSADKSRCATCTGRNQVLSQARKMGGVISYRVTHRNSARVIVKGLPSL